MFIVLIDFI